MLRSIIFRASTPRVTAAFMTQTIASAVLVELIKVSRVRSHLALSASLPPSPCL